MNFFRGKMVPRSDYYSNAEKQGLKPNDLVILKADSSVEKVEGDAVSYLIERAGKKVMKGG